jgi:hypothetical protein
MLGARTGILALRYIHTGCGTHASSYPIDTSGKGTSEIRQTLTSATADVLLLLLLFFFSLQEYIQQKPLSKF